MYKMSTDLIAKIVTELLDDVNFVKDCEKELKEIMKDGKFDFNDMPQVVTLVVLVYEKYDNLHVEEKDVADVFKLLILELLKKMGWVTEEKKEQIEKMVESCITLLMLNINTQTIWKKITSCFKKIKCSNCCMKCKC